MNAVGGKTKTCVTDRVYRVNSMGIRIIKKAHLPVLVVFLLACTSCSDAPDTLVTEGYDEKEMEAAIARAKVKLMYSLTN
jgi:hypothetical protein